MMVRREQNSDENHIHCIYNEINKVHLYLLFISSFIHLIDGKIFVSSCSSNIKAWTTP